MQAGYAQANITPDPGEELTGYGYYLNRRATGTLDSLHARALALEEGGVRAVIVQLDLLGLSRNYVMEVRAAVERRTGLPGTHLLLHCTHTHSGPGSLRAFGCGMPSEHFQRLLHGQIVSTVAAALEDLRPVDAASRFSTDWPRGFAYNRIGAAELDTRVYGLRIQVRGARPIVVLSYACHPVTLGINTEYSADYCGAVVRELNAYGDRALFLNGCCGDVDPVSNACAWGSGTRETLLIYGRDLVAVARGAMETATDWRMGALRAASRVIRLDAEPTTLAELETSLSRLRAALRDEGDDGLKRVDASWHEVMIQAHRDGRVDEIGAAEIQAIACGEVVFVGMSAEAFTGLGGIIRAQAPAHQLMIAGTSNGVIGYIGTEEDARQRGYASGAACKIYGMPVLVPGAGEKWARAGAEVVAEVLD